MSGVRHTDCARSYELLSERLKSQISPWQQQQRRRAMIQRQRPRPRQSKRPSKTKTKNRPVYLSVRRSVCRHMQVQDAVLKVQQQRSGSGGWHPFFFRSKYCNLRTYWTVTYILGWTVVYIPSPYNNDHLNISQPTQSEKKIKKSRWGRRGKREKKGNLGIWPRGKGYKVDETRPLFFFVYFLLLRFYHLLLNFTIHYSSFQSSASPSPSLSIHTEFLTLRTEMTEHLPLLLLPLPDPALLLL